MGCIEQRVLFEYGISEQILYKAEVFGKLTVVADARLSNWSRQL